MSKRFDWLRLNARSGTGFWLRAAAAVLAVLNVVAVYLYVAPPGGSRRDLMDQDASIRRDTLMRRTAANRLKMVSEKVQLGGEETEHFTQQYFLPRRTAFAVLLSELLRMSKEAGLHEGQRTYSQEPIENTDDLTLLTINANYQGSFADLMHFLNQVDRSDQLLILDTLTATPVQQGTGGALNVTTRFLAIVKEDGSPQGALSTTGSGPGNNPGTQP